MTGATNCQWEPASWIDGDRFRLAHSTLSRCVKHQRPRPVLLLAKDFDVLTGKLFPSINEGALMLMYFAKSSSTVLLFSPLCSISIELVSFRRWRFSNGQLARLVKDNLVAYLA